MDKYTKDTNNKVSVEAYDTNVIPMDITEYTKQVMLKYGINVVLARAVSSINDGLKLGARRILWVMYELGLKPGRMVKANEFLGHVQKYHPHGDLPINSTFENMTKFWETNAMLIDIVGNKGSVAGFKSAAARYLEGCLSLYAYECFFKEFDPDITDMMPNYTKTSEEPVHIPSKYPHFLIGCSVGVGWGHAQYVPAYNLEEVFRLTIELIKNPNLENVYLYPDSPRGYDIIASDDIAEICSNGHGSLQIRARLQYHKDGHYISVTGFPEATTMKSITERIATLSKEKKISYIKDIADRTKFDHVEFWIYLTKDADPNIVIRDLYKKTPLQGYLHINMTYAERTSIVHLGIKESLLLWIDRRIDQKQKIYNKKLNTLKERMHTLDILIRISSSRKDVDTVINIIRDSEDNEHAAKQLVELYGITSYQANIIGGMKLSQFTKSNVVSWKKEFDELEIEIDKTEQIVRSKNMIKDIIIDELNQGIELFGKPRSCRIIKGNAKEAEIKYNVVVTQRYIKKLSTYTKNIGIVELSDEVVSVFNDVTDNSSIMMIDENGKCYTIKVGMLPTNDISSKGTELLSSFGVSSKVIKSVNMSNLSDSNETKLLMFTNKGNIKKTDINQYIRSRTSKSTMTGIVLNDGDKVCSITYTHGDKEHWTLMYTKSGLGITMDLQQIPETNRQTIGSNFLKLESDDVVIGTCPIDESNDIQYILVITVKGKAKICVVSDVLKTSKRRQDMIRLTSLDDGDSVFKIIPIDIDNTKSISVAMQSGDKKIVDMSEIKTTTRLSKGFKVIPVKRGDSIIKIKLIY